MNIWNINLFRNLLKKKKQQVIKEIFCIHVVFFTIVGPFDDGDSDGIVYAKCRFVACSGKSFE